MHALTIHGSEPILSLQLTCRVSEKKCPQAYSRMEALAPEALAPEATAVSVAADHMLSMMLQSAAWSKTRTLPPIRVVFLAREATRSALVGVADDGARNVEAIVANACDRALPVVRAVLLAIADIVDPNLESLRSAVGEMLVSGCDEGVRILVAADDDGASDATAAERHARAVLDRIEAAQAEAQAQFVGATIACASQHLAALNHASTASTADPVLMRLCTHGVAMRCARACTLTTDELAARLSDAAGKGHEASIEAETGVVDVTDGAGGPSAAHHSRSTRTGTRIDVLAVEAGYAAAAEEARRRLRDAHLHSRDSGAELRGALANARRALGALAPTGAEHASLLPMIELGQLRLDEIDDEIETLAVAAPGPAPGAAPGPAPGPAPPAARGAAREALRSTSRAWAPAPPPSAATPSAAVVSADAALPSANAPPHQAPLSSTASPPMTMPHSRVREIGPADNVSVPVVPEVSASHSLPRAVVATMTDDELLAAAIRASLSGARNDAVDIAAQQQRQQQRQQQQQQQQQPATVVQLTSAELHRATHGFDASRILGEGGFGKVFATDDGALPSLCRMGRVAVKKLDDESMQSELELHNEIDVLALCRHENMLPLLGYCLEPHARCLVYPLMAGGNLEEALQLSGAAAAAAAAAAEGESLSWRVRLRILRAASRALVYLHTPSRQKGVVLHCDIKPANILLDEHLNAKLSDVGLAVHKAGATSRSSGGGSGAAEHYSAHLKGTIGYLDPIYMQTGMFTVHADAYAMGITMLVSLTGLDAQPAMRRCEALLEDPNRVASYVDSRAGWPTTTAVGGSSSSGGSADGSEASIGGRLVKLIVGLVCGGVRRRMLLDTALTTLEDLCEDANLRPGVSDTSDTGASSSSGPDAGMDGEEATGPKECVICMSAPRELRFACGHLACCAECTDALCATEGQRCPYVTRGFQLPTCCTLPLACPSPSAADMHIRIARVPRVRFPHTTAARTCARCVERASS